MFVTRFTSSKTRSKPQLYPVVGGPVCHVIRPGEGEGGGVPGCGGSRPVGVEGGVGARGSSPPAAETPAWVSTASAVN